MVIKVILIIPVILTVVAYFRTLSVRSKRSRRKEYAVYLPNSWRTLLISLAVTSEIFSFIAILDNDNKEVEICFFIFAFLFLFLIRGWKNWYIIYDDKGFLETTFGGKKRYFTYNQVTAYRKWYTRNGGEYCVFVENKRVYVDFEAVNCGEFMSYVKEKYKMLHNDEELPENNGRWFGNCLNIREHERKTYMNNRNLMYDLKPFWIYWGVLVLACILFFICP